MESMGQAMRELMERIDRMRTHSTTSMSGLPKQTYDCEKCQDIGTVNTFRKEQPEGYPFPVEVAKVEMCSCHFDKQFEKYNAAAGFTDKEKGFTFKTAVIDDENRPHFEIAVDFIKNIDNHLKWGTWLYLFGDEFRARNLSESNTKDYSAFGTGKTHLMQCIANALANRKIPSIYVKEEQLFTDIKATYDRGSDESEQDVLRRYYSIPVLMIDDLFTAPYKDWAEGKLFSILDERVDKKKITIITSNYAVGRISQRLPINGGKIASRISGQAQLIEMIGTDRRRTIARKRRDETA